MTQLENVSLAPKKGGRGITGLNYADTAEKVVAPNGSLRFGKLSTSKLRGIYGLITNVYTRVNKPEDFEACKPDLQYVKVKMAYESGRNSDVKQFIGESGLMDYLDSVQSYGQFILYCRYAESLVAYFKFYGGKE